MWKVITCWSIKWRLLLLRQQSSHLQIVPQRGLKCCFCREMPTKLSVPPLYSPFWTLCMQYLEGSKELSKKCDGGSNRNLNGESAKETMRLEMRVSRYNCLLSLVVVLYTSVGYSECQRSACITSAKQSAVYPHSAKKNIVTLFFSSTNEDK